MAVKKIVKLGGILLLLILVVVFWFATRGDKKPDVHATDVSTGQEAQENSGAGDKSKKERKIKYWQAPMDPTYVRDKPGKSPMGMDLIPVYEDDEPSAEGVIRIDPVTVQNIGVRTAKVSKGPLYVTIRTVGHVTYDEERVEHIHTKISGWVEKLFVDTTGEEVHKGQDLLTIYSPELVATQEEYLQALRYKEKTAGSSFVDVVSGAETLLEATKRRLLLMDIRSDQIRALEERGEARKAMLLRSPNSGIVIEKHVFEGMEVTPGMKLYTIADLSRVWVIASIYEYEFPFLKVGQEAEMTLAYEPGAVYKGHITFVYPYLSAKTRTVQVRMEFENPGLKLKPDMYVDVVIKTEASGEAILVPSEAVIRTGVRNVVITALGDGKFLPKDVTLGPEGEGIVQILSGLKEGEIVVTSGQFLIDSESNLREAINKMLEAKKASQAMKEEQGSEPPAGHKTGEMKMEKESLPMVHIDMNKDQKNMMTKVIDSYMRMHSALVSEEVSEVAEEARIMADVIKRMETSGPEGRLKEVIGSIEGSLEGLLSGELEKVRKSFAILSKGMAVYVKGAGRKDAVSAGIKVYICPMKEERWLQKEEDVQNPYLGKDMLICGNEEKY